MLVNCWSCCRQALLSHDLSNCVNMRAASPIVIIVSWCSATKIAIAIRYGNIGFSCLHIRSHSTFIFMLVSARGVDLIREVDFKKADPIE